jgi:DNA-binding response OmpR family regulator
MSFSDAPHFSATAGSLDDDAERAADPLRGRRILIVEDDPYITIALEETLAEQGLVIAGTARNIEAALRLARSEPLDLALLDVNIGPEKIDPVADVLAERGCPFVFTTGCGRAGLPEAYLDRAIVEKPFYIEEILKSLRDELSGISGKR